MVRIGNSTTVRFLSISPAHDKNDCQSLPDLSAPHAAPHGGRQNGGKSGGKTQRERQSAS
ncbi:hypothetical protein THICB2_470052 [Thiomonas sp. CB2]|nr:hypothetical protein THICB2_470052 [Thiomonas sp. CB2]